MHTRRGQSKYYHATTLQASDILRRARTSRSVDQCTFRNEMHKWGTPVELALVIMRICLLHSGQNRSAQYSSVLSRFSFHMNNITLIMIEFIHILKICDVFSLRTQFSESVSRQVSPLFPVVAQRFPSRWCHSHCDDGNIGHTFGVTRNWSILISIWRLYLQYHGGRYHCRRYSMLWLEWETLLPQGMSPVSEIRHPATKRRAFPPSTSYVKGYW